MRRMTFLILGEVRATLVQGEVEPTNMSSRSVTGSACAALTAVRLVETCLTSFFHGRFSFGACLSRRVLSPKVVVSRSQLAAL
eukprot:6341847-Amphidinium_carterae.1